MSTLNPYTETIHLPQPLPPVKVPYYKNNGYRTVHILNKIFRKNPNNPLQVCFDSAIEIKESYQEKDDRRKIEEAN